MEQNKFVHCTKCDSKAVQVRSGWMFVITSICMGSCLFWLGFLFFPLWIFAFLMVVGSPFFLLVPKHFFCMNCKTSWRVPKQNKKQADM